jgi:hypothetical protein
VQGLVDAWDAIGAAGIGFVMFLAAVGLYAGRIVNGQQAEKELQSALEARDKAHEAQIAQWRERYEEMQAVWEARYRGAQESSDYFRSIALSFARHAEEGIALAKEKIPQL